MSRTVNFSALDQSYMNFPYTIMRWKSFDLKTFNCDERINEARNEIEVLEAHVNIIAKVFPRSAAKTDRESYVLCNTDMRGKNYTYNLS